MTRIPHINPSAARAAEGFVQNGRPRTFREHLLWETGSRPYAGLHGAIDIRRRADASRAPGRPGDYARFGGGLCPAQRRGASVFDRKPAKIGNNALKRLISRKEIDLVFVPKDLDFVPSGLDFVPARLGFRSQKLGFYSGLAWQTLRRGSEGPPRPAFRFRRKSGDAFPTESARPADATPGQRRRARIWRRNGLKTLDPRPKMARETAGPETASSARTGAAFRRPAPEKPSPRLRRPRCGPRGAGREKPP